MSEVYSTSGQYDLLMKWLSADSADIGHFVTGRLQTLPGVTDSFTIIAVKAFSADTRVSDCLNVVIPAKAESSAAIMPFAPGPPLSRG